MRMLHPLPDRVAPVGGEAFASFVDRVAALYRVPLSTALHRTGVTDDDSFRALPVGYGVVLAPDRLEAFAHATRLTPERVTGMLLAGYQGGPLDLSGLDMAAPRSVRAVALREWGYFAGSHACPSCLADDGAWRVRWKLPWSFACVRHRRLLIDTCPDCGRRSGIGRRDGMSAPAFPGRVPQPGRCRNALPTGLAGAGRAGLPCDSDLGGAVAHRLATNDPALAAQTTLDALLDAGGAAELFAGLRAVCALVLHHGGPEHVGADAAPAVEAFANHVACRDAVREERGAMIGAGVDGRHGPRTRSWTAVPQSAALMAAVVPAALRVLEPEDPHVVAERLAPLLDTAAATARGLTVVTRIPHDSGFTPPLRAAFDAWQDGRPRRKAVHRYGVGARTSRRWGVTAAQVPQLLWAEEYRDRFAELLPDSREHMGRRFAAMALVKTVEPVTWRQAARRLDLNPRRSVGLVNHYMVVLNSRGHTEAFFTRARDLADRLDADPHRVDYGALRRAHAGLADLDPAAWARACREAGVHPGQGARRRNAATWVWTELTGGDWRLAPAFRDRDTDNAREVYRRFLREVENGLSLPLALARERVGAGGRTRAGPRKG